jgi:hypothetical protein
MAAAAAAPFRNRLRLLSAMAARFYLELIERGKPALNQAFVLVPCAAAWNAAAPYS